MRTNYLKPSWKYREQTFQDIGQEIHKDNIGQVLSFIKLNINTINIDDSAAAKKITGVKTTDHKRDPGPAGSVKDLKH